MSVASLSGVVTLGETADLRITLKRQWLPLVRFGANGFVHPQGLVELFEMSGIRGVIVYPKAGLLFSDMEPGAGMLEYVNRKREQAVFLPQQLVWGSSTNNLSGIDAVYCGKGGQRLARRLITGQTGGGDIEICLEPGNCCGAVFRIGRREQTYVLGKQESDQSLEDLLPLVFSAEPRIFQETKIGGVSIIAKKDGREIVPWMPSDEIWEERIFHPLVVHGFYTDERQVYVPVGDQKSGVPTRVMSLSEFPSRQRQEMW